MKCVYSMSLLSIYHILSFSGLCNPITGRVGDAGRSLLSVINTLICMKADPRGKSGLLHISVHWLVRPLTEDSVLTVLEPPEGLVLKTIDWDVEWNPTAKSAVLEAAIIEWFSCTAFSCTHVLFHYEGLLGSSNLIKLKALVKLCMKYCLFWSRSISTVRI